VADHIRYAGFSKTSRIADDRIMETNAHETLVEDAAGGDEPAIEVLLDRHLPALTGYIRLHADPVIRRMESCADIAQSVCREALQDMDGFDYRGEGPFRNWLFTKAMSKLVDRKEYYLREKRDVRRNENQPAAAGRTALECLFATLETPSQGAIANETIERMESAFDRLPEDYKRVISLARLVGLTHAEIAAEMGREVGAVRVLLHRALGRLGRLMNEPSR
jgi:RNA polymerase sigma-70 factor, ECF subfamily